MWPPRSASSGHRLSGKSTLSDATTATASSISSSFGDSDAGDPFSSPLRSLSSASSSAAADSLDSPASRAASASLPHSMAQSLSSAALLKRSGSSSATDVVTSGYNSLSSDDEEFDSQQSAAAAAAGETIRVTVRFRPLLSREKTNSQSAWSVHPQTNTITQVASLSSNINPSSSPDATSSRASHPSRSRRNGGAYAFDEVYSERHSTQAIYEGIAQSIARSALDGIHGSIFAYGQTSSGKTFTMQGTSLSAITTSSSRSSSFKRSPSSDDTMGLNTNGVDTLDDETKRPLQTDGIIQLAVKDIFDEMVKRQANATFVVRVSYIEIYNETVRDLLVDTAGSTASSSSSGGAMVNVREHPVHGVFTDASERVASDARSVLKALRDGERNRSIGATNMNEKSSRSHTIFRVVIESRAVTTALPLSSVNQDGSNNIEVPSEASKVEKGAFGDCVRIGCLNFVDLAGSESSQRTGAQGKRLTEAGNINRSLLALSQVISALSSSSSSSSSRNSNSLRDEPHQHISFRDSKLTRILQPSLSGAARVLFICCASPAIQFAEDTKSTLQFASRAKRVQIHASVNEIVENESENGIKRASMMKTLQQENEELRKDLERMQGMQELATNLKKQIQMLEMEMLIRGSESRESLTGLMSSLELRESFRTSDCTSAFMLGDDGEFGDYDSEYDEVQPEEERESIGDSQSFFVENLIDPNDMTDDEEEYDDAFISEREPPETIVEPAAHNCLECEELQHEIKTIREVEAQRLSAIAQLEAELAKHQQRVQLTEAHESSRLQEVEAQQRIHQLELDCVALQKLAHESEAASQKKIQELEIELAHASKLSQHQQLLLDAFQQENQITDEEERLLLVESGGVLGEERQHPSTQGFSLSLLLRGWGRAESTTLLVALVLICVTLYFFSEGLASVFHR